MPERSDSQRPSKFAESMQRAIDARVNAARESVILQNLLENKRWEFRRAVEIDTQLLTSHEALMQSEENAARLKDRHQQHWISSDLIEAVLPLKGDATETENALSPFRKRANKTGFFLMEYSQEMMLERLTSSSYVIAEASGKHPAEGHPRHNIMAPAADCQCCVPDARADAAFVFDLPEAGDDVRARELVEEMRQRPWETAEVKDLATDFGMENCGLAGAARSAVFDHIRNVINPQRGEFPIRHIAASIAHITGVELPNKKTVKLISDLRSSAGIFNTHSVHAHTVGRYPAIPAYHLLNRKVPVEVEGQEYSILVDWWMYFHDLLRKVEIE